MFLLRYLDHNGTPRETEVEATDYEIESRFVTFYRHTTVPPVGKMLSVPVDRVLQISYAEKINS
jgi:hypothetical protein